MISPNKYLKHISLPPRAHSIKLLGKMRSKKGIFKLDSNEAVIPPSPKVVKAITAFLKEKNNLNWYPNPNADELRNQIAKYVGIQTEYVMPSNGSEQTFEFICNLFLDTGDEVLIPSPTFGPFKVWAEIRNAKVVDLTYDIKKPFDMNKVSSKVTRRTKLIYLVNPYILTIPQRDIEMLVKKNPNVIVIVDEAYHEYFGETSTTLVKKYQNLIVTRTFSKTFMLAGLRLGYMIAQPDIITAASTVSGLYPVNVLTHVAGVAALQDRSRTKRYCVEVTQSMKLLTRELPKLGFEAIPTHASLMLFSHSHIAPPAAQKKLEAVGIFVRYPFFKELPQYLRMNVGNLEFTKRLLAKFKKAF